MDWNYAIRFVADNVGVDQDVYRLVNQREGTFLGTRADGTLYQSYNNAAGVNWYLVPRYKARDDGYIPLRTEQP